MFHNKIRDTNTCYLLCRTTLSEDVRFCLLTMVNTSNGIPFDWLVLSFLGSSLSLRRLSYPIIHPLFKDIITTIRFGWMIGAGLAGHQDKS